MSQLNEVGKEYHRPWGSYKTIAMANGYQVKTITVSPGGRLSLQSHEHRAEHWVVVKGIATVTINETVKEYEANEAVYIPPQARHRLENFTQAPVVIVETQVGAYLGEDDIKRYADIYGREL